MANPLCSLLFADFMGIDSATLTILIGAAGTALGATFAGLRVVALWVATTIKEVIGEHKSFLDDMKKNDAKRVDILASMGNSIASNGESFRVLAAEIGDVKDDVHIVKTDIAVIKDRFAERASSTNIPKMKQPQGA